MKTLSAYDFDKTLIPYDSFQRYLLHLLRRRPFSIIGLLLLRKLRIISSRRLKQYVTHIVEQSPFLIKGTKHFAQCMIYDIQWPPKVHQEEVVLIISASPMVYMRYVKEELQCELMCSDFMGEKYVEMFGKAKLENLIQRYPQSEYNYVSAMSDSESDKCWLQEFKQYEIVKR